MTRPQAGPRQSPCRSEGSRRHSYGPGWACDTTRSLAAHRRATRRSPCGRSDAAPRDKPRLLQTTNKRGPSGEAESDPDRDWHRNLRGRPRMIVRTCRSFDEPAEQIGFWLKAIQLPLAGFDRGRSRSCGAPRRRVAPRRPRRGEPRSWIRWRASASGADASSGLRLPCIATLVGVEQFSPMSCSVRSSSADLEKYSFAPPRDSGRCCPRRPA